jgi:hypothetical protein
MLAELLWKLYDTWIGYLEIVPYLDRIHGLGPTDPHAVLWRVYLTAKILTMALFVMDRSGNPRSPLIATSHVRVLFLGGRGGGFYF